MFAICHLFYRGFEKEKKKAKKRAYVPVCTCAREAMYRSAQKDCRFHDRSPLPYVAARHGMRAKPCYRIGELALTALRMELITIEHT